MSAVRLPRCPPTPRRRAVGVVRVSTEKQAEIGATAQRAEIEAWAIREGVELVAVHEDIGISGAAPLSERKGLLAALASAAEARAGVLVAVKRDRFSRSRHTIADLERAAARIGAVLVTTDGICTGEDSELAELTTGMQDLLAALELRRIRARNRARARQCIAAGRTHGGTLPYGYRRKPGGAKGKSGAVVELELHPEEQATISMMQRLRAEGATYRKVAAALDLSGRPAPAGDRWHPRAVQRILARAERTA